MAMGSLPRTVTISVDRLSAVLVCTAAACYVLWAVRRAQQSHQYEVRGTGGRGDRPPLPAEQTTSPLLHGAAAAAAAAVAPSEPSATVAVAVAVAAATPGGEGPRPAAATVSTQATASTQQAALGNAARVAQYDGMATAFASQGLDAAAVEGAQTSFGGLEQTEWPGIWPKPYPVPFPSVRLVVVPLNGGQIGVDASLAQAGVAASTEMLRALAGRQVYVNPRSGHHASLFYLSHPSDLRPDTGVAGGGELFHNGAVRTPDEDMLDAERTKVAQVAKVTAPITLEVERVVFTRGGTLLVVFTDVSSYWSSESPVDTLRARFKEQFPGAPTKQPQPIIHSTLVRLLAPATPLSPTESEKIQRLCSKWTAKLKGKRYTSDRVWLVHEKSFSSLEGEKDTYILQKK